MIQESLKELFTRDLKKLKAEIRMYSNESNLWTIEGSIKNSGGNLCLHIIGNLKAYIGNGLTKIGYKRQRELEFSGKNIDRNILYIEIERTIDIVNRGLDKLNEINLKENFPVVIWEEETGMIFTLIHLHSHLNYHLGQINYHRRILEKN